MFTRITLPLLTPALISAWLLAFTLSLDALASLMLLFVSVIVLLAERLRQSG